MNATTHETFSHFLDAAHDDLLIIRSCGELWLAWETEDGEWFAVRPRSDEDQDGPDGDRWRPVGPTPVESMTFPLVAVRLGELFSHE